MWMRTEERIDEDSIGLKAMLAGFAPPFPLVMTFGEDKMMMRMRIDEDRIANRYPFFCWPGLHIKGSHWVRGEA